mmetsp:Transcript_33483/g.40563  ORF Transcript_33483/g.40563 Transcript_33483/m.40563 type:complete len:287 (+) Transcript_33483:74-934(+)
MATFKILVWATIFWNLFDTYAFVTAPQRRTSSLYKTLGRDVVSHSFSHVHRASREDDDSTDAGISDTDDTDEPEDITIRLLGRGNDAVVRVGCVLLAPTHEYSHWLMKAAIFVFAIGLNDDGEKVTRGIVIDNPTVFTMNEMAPGMVNGILAGNILFKGGDGGNDSAIMMHSYPLETSSEVGTSGIYEGGLQEAMDMADSGEVDPTKIKFFFNYVEFSDAELRDMLSSSSSAGNGREDTWASVELMTSSVDLVVDWDLRKGQAWQLLRNKMRNMERVLDEEADAFQ